MNKIYLKLVVIIGVTHLEDPPLPQKNRDIDINIWTQLSLSVICHPQKIDPYEVLGLACFRIQQWSTNLWTQRINTFYCVSFFVFQILDLKTFVSKAVIWHSSFIRISTQGTFHQRKIRAFSLITLALLDHVKWRSDTFSFWYTFPSSLLVVFQVITQLHHMPCRSGSVSFWYVFPPHLVIVAFVIVALWRF